MKPEELLAHADFVRVLTRRLVLDENAADDIAQQTWLAALERPPASNRSAPAWLSRVASNFVRRMKRGEGRRMVRERTSAVPERVPSAAEVAEQEEIRRRVVAAVLDLDEPYRSAILLRFYRDLPPREVARSLDVPVETARSRIRRGLAQLRERLDSEHASDGKSWLAALAPIAGLELVPPAAAPALFPALIKGVLLMSPKVKVGIAATAVFLAVFTAWHVLFVLPEDGRQSNAAGPLEPGPAAMAEDAAENDIALTAVDNAEPALETVAIEDTGPFIAGRVVDKVTREPVTSFHMWVPRATWEGKKGIDLHTTVHDEEGRFHVALSRGGRCIFKIRNSRYAWQGWRIFDVPAETGLSDLVIELDPGLSYSGKVVADETAEPVAGALILPSQCYPDTDRILWLENGYPEYCTHTRSGEDGSFKLEGVTETDNCFAVLHPDYAQGVGWIKKGIHDGYEIRLTKGFKIYGRVVRETGDPVAGAAVRVFSDNIYNNSIMWRATLTGSDGGYISVPLFPGDITVTVASPAWDTHNELGLEEMQKLVKLVDSDVEVNFGVKEEFVTWKGRLLDSIGAPVADGSVQVKLEAADNWALSNFRHGSRRSIKCDEQGRFELSELTPGTYEVEISISGFIHSLSMGTMRLTDPGIVDMDIQLSPVQLRGRIVNAGDGETITGVLDWIRFTSMSDRDYMSSFTITEKGRFEVLGLKPGEYRYSITMPGYAPMWEGRISIGENPTREELVVPLLPGGRLLGKLGGFPDSDRRSMKVICSLENGRSWNLYPSMHTWKNDSYSWEWHLEPCRGTLVVSLKDGGFIEKKFEVQEGEATQLTVHRDEARYLDKEITVSGSLKLADGAPVVGAEISFSPWFLIGEFPEGKKFEAETDDEGHFEFSGFKPGEWRIRTKLNESDRVNFEPLEIPMDAGDELTLDLAIPGGSVKGEVYDAWTGRPMADSGARCHIGVSSLEKREVRADSWTRAADRFFTVAGVPSGRVRAYVVVTGYATHNVESFVVPEGGTVDLGRIPLQPDGKLQLEVVDEKGQPVIAHSVDWLDSRLKPDGPKFEATGVNVYGGLPLGTLSFSISAAGFKPYDATAVISPRERCKLKVVLERE